MNSITQDLNNPNLLGFTNVSNSIGRLGGYEGVAGAVALHEGEKDGGLLVSKALAYRFLEVSLKVAISKKPKLGPGRSSGRSLTNTYDLMGCLSAAALATESWVILQELIGFIEFSRAGGSLVDEGVLNTAYCVNFVYFLSLVLKNGGVSDYDLYSLGEYDSIFKAWGDPMKLSSALSSICDYHMSNILERRNRVGQFRFKPFDLMPFEVKALIKVRSLLDMETFLPSHDLINKEFILNDSFCFSFDNLCAGVNSDYMKSLASPSLIPEF
ncbi:MULTISPECIES: hypothetical protein [Xanthomonas]|uniref:hypothetical protein n=1 Tax=Xanthomonas TaxID=338 RepID=UPI0012906133|nr:MULTISPECIES: hypothetical protein [Xanthomonas]